MIFCLYSSCQVRLDPYCRSFQSGTVSAHSPSRGAIQVFIEMALVNKISTHAPHARRGEFNTIHATTIRFFLLTRLMRGAASTGCQPPPVITISTHAPHARRGADPDNAVFGYQDFYSRASCEARLDRCLDLCFTDFISTHAPHARRG